jgi:DNA-binding NarL/FixJ family response regulator
MAGHAARTASLCVGRSSAFSAGSAVPHIPASRNAPPASLCNADAVPLRCLIVDDNAAFVRAAVALLEREGLTVVGVASNTAHALRQAQDLRPDIILVDLLLGPESGFHLARQLTEMDGWTVILISTHAEADFADLISSVPVAGFVSKSELSGAAIRRLAGAS